MTPHPILPGEEKIMAPTLVEALENIHSWLVCWPIATDADMAQGFEPMEALAAQTLAAHREREGLSATRIDEMVSAGRDALQRRRYDRLREFFVTKTKPPQSAVDDAIAGDARACIEAALDAQAASLAVPVGVDLLTDITQILDVVKQEWGAEGCWSEWDQSVRDRITEVLRAAWNRRADLSGSVGEGVLASRDHAHTHNAAMRASSCTDQDGECT